jgi:SAM-dependent methyltransferase
MDFPELVQAFADNDMLQRAENISLSVVEDVVGMSEISKWIEDHINLLPRNGHVLDLACGGGRHSRHLAAQGHDVTAVDIDTTGIEAAMLSGVEIVSADLEEGPWPFVKSSFDSIIVVNYLWRPQFNYIKATLKPGGVLIWDTFALGNEKYGKPSNPKFLLKPDELKQAFEDFDCLDYWEGIVDQPSPAVRQSIACRKPQKA